MFEKRFAAVTPQLLTSDGTNAGKITVLDASLYKVKQSISLQNTAGGARQYQVQRITDINTIYLGPLGSSDIVNERSDVSAYTTALGSFIFAVEQKRTSVPEQEIERLTYEEEPTVARRVVIVDKMGDKIDANNPLPVDATVSVVVPPVTVDIDALTPPTRSDPDNILAVGSDDGTKEAVKRAVRVDSDFDLRTGISDGANKAEVDSFRKLMVRDTGAATILTAIQSVLENDVLEVNDQETQDILTDIFDQLAQGGIIKGTEDGTISGVQRIFVNNIRQQVLASHDRNRTLTWVDPDSKKNRRVTRMEYTSAVVGFTARKDITYTLTAVGDYIVNEEFWSVL